MLHRDADLIRDVREEINFVFAEESLSLRTSPNVPTTRLRPQIGSMHPVVKPGASRSCPGKCALAILATARPGLGSLDHVSGDGTEEGNGGTFLKICFAREIERINLEFSALRGFQENADTIASKAASDAHHHGPHNIPKFLVGGGLFGHFEQQFEAGLFAPQLREHFCRPGQNAAGDPKLLPSVLHKERSVYPITRSKKQSVLETAYSTFHLGRRDQPLLCFPLRFGMDSGASHRLRCCVPPAPQAAIGMLASPYESSHALTARVPSSFLVNVRFPAGVKIDSYEVAQANLGAGNEVGQRRHQILFDRPLQVSRSVFDIRAFFQEEVLYRLCAIEYEALVAGRLQDPFLQHPQFDFEDLRQVFQHAAS